MARPKPPFPLSADSTQTAAAALVALRGLVSLEKHVLELRRWSRQLDAAFGAGLAKLALEASLGLREVLSHVAVLYMRLRVGVVAFDGAALGETLGSFGELVLRAQMFIVAVQLSQLRDAIERATNNGGHDMHPRLLFDHRLRTIDEIGAFFRLEFNNITATWLPHRPDRPVYEPGILRGSPESRYHNAIHAARRTMAAIVEDRSIAAFLRAGVASSDWPAVQSACTRISLALQINVAPELDTVRASQIPRRWQGFAEGPATEQ